MLKRMVGFTASGDSVTVVDTEVPDDNTAPISVLSDTTWKLQEGDRGQALDVLYRRCSDYLRENGVDRVIIKASALSTGPAKLALLTSAEVRGVVIAAAASVCEVDLVSKAVLSRTYGDRKVDEYLKDDAFWDTQVRGGKLRRISREAAMLVVARRHQR